MTAVPAILCRSTGGRAVTLMLSTFLALVLVACSQPDLPPAPLGQNTALEKLASAFDALAERMPTSPHNQVPADKRDFVEAVFEQAGYSYEATLQQLASEAFDPGIRLHRDLAELVLYPVAGITPEDMAKVYNADEMASIDKVRAAMRG